MGRNRQTQAQVGLWLSHHYAAVLDQVRSRHEPPLSRAEWCRLAVGAALRAATLAETLGEGAALGAPQEARGGAPFPGPTQAPAGGAAATPDGLPGPAPAATSQFTFEQGAVRVDMAALAATTRTGHEASEDEIGAWAAEAERGYCTTETGSGTCWRPSPCPEHERGQSW
jgi:hypothetical protein